MQKEWIPDKKIAGLGLMVLPSGVQTFYLRYREPSGRQQTHRIGRAGVVSLPVAREEAIKILADVARGKTPTTDRKELRSSPTVADLAARVTREHYAKLRPKTVIDYEVAWRLHILPVIGSHKVATVTTAQVLKLLAGVAPTQGNRVLAVLRKAMNLAILWGLRETNPCAKVPGNGETRRRRYLTRAELERLVAALEAFAPAGVRWRFAQLIRLLLLTGARVREVMHAEWDWVREEQLVVPARQHKTGRDGHPRVIHLAPEAMAVLAQLKAQSNSRWVIQGDGDGHLIGYAKLWAELMEMAQIQDLRVHDLRHSYASTALSAGLTLPQIGGLLGHASPQTTARYAHLQDEVAAALAAKAAGAFGRL
jgi:integrase